MATVKHNTKYLISNIPFLAILLLALALRVYHLDAQSLWYDEAVTAQVAAQGVAELTRWTAGDIQPPLYYYWVAGWTRLAGQSEWALRFPSTFFGVLTVALLWTTARRLFGRHEAGIAALLAAISPLFVYYAQEARMYTLLTLLGVLAGYALLRASQGSGNRRQGAVWWAAFVAAATAMLYTHYFGVFLLAAYGVCLILACFVPSSSRAARRARLGVRSLFAFLAIALLYLPWLPAMLNRYRVDASYWQGSLKLGEALRHIAISFTTAAPEMMLEADAVRLLPWFAVAFGAAGVALLWRGSRGDHRSRVHGGRGAGVQGGRALVYLSTCLLLPILAVLVLAARTPKFNPRYLMLVSPAYLLILAGGIGSWMLGTRYWILRAACGVLRDPIRNVRNSGAHSTQYLIPNIILTTLLCFLIATSVAALRNWFTAPAFTKAQWREVAAFVRQARGADEVVLLVSGHAYPAWDHYAADIPAVRLPPIDILDVNAVLGFEVGSTLAQALVGRGGAWLVSWQDAVVDPVGFVPYFLAHGGAEQPAERQFWHVGLRHWRLRPDATFPAAPQPQHADVANFDHKLALLGWDEGPAAGEITVYWRTLNTLTADYQLSLALEDSVGREVGRWDGRPAGYAYPTDRWRPGQALFGRYQLPVPADLPAGSYYITLAIYDAADPAGLDIRDVADNPAGKRARIGPVWLER